MELETLRFGKIKIQDDKIIHFPKGILGFSDQKDFILFPHSEDSPFFWLQSVSDGELAFVTMDPTLVVDNYTIDIDEDTVKDLKAHDESDLELLCIVTVPQNQPEKMTINLLGPIVIHTKKRQAVQIISTSGQFSHRHPVIAENKATECRS